MLLCRGNALATPSRQSPSCNLTCSYKKNHIVTSTLRTVIDPLRILFQVQLRFWATAKKICGEDVCQIGPLTFNDSQSAKASSGLTENCRATCSLDAEVQMLHDVIRSRSINKALKGTKRSEIESGAQSVSPGGGVESRATDKVLSNLLCGCDLFVGLLSLQ